MTKKKSVSRIEPINDDGVRVVTPSYRDLRSRIDAGRQNPLTVEHADLFVSTVPKKGGPERVRIGTAAHHDDCDGWFIHGANGIYAEVPFEERELTEPERAWCDDTFQYRDLETVVEIEIPTPENLRSAILDEAIDRYDCLDAVIENHDVRHDVLTDLQERFATEQVRQNQLDTSEGIISDLDGVWHPEDSHNDGKTRQHLYDMVSMRADAHLVDFEDVAGFPYRAFRNARLRVLGTRSHKLDARKHLPLDVAGYPDWTFCRLCGAVAPEEKLLLVELELNDRTRTQRCCDRCAEMRVEWDHETVWNEDVVAKAQDERAQRQGEGQRRIGGDYDEVDDGE